MREELVGVGFGLGGGVVGGEEARGLDGRDGLEGGGGTGGLCGAQPGVQGGGGPVGVGDEPGGLEGGERRVEGGLDGGGRGGGGLDDVHVGHAEGEVVVRVVDGDVLAGAGVGAGDDAGGGEAGALKEVLGDSAHYVVADGTTEADGATSEMSSTSNVVGDASKCLLDGGLIRCVQLRGYRGLGCGVGRWDIVACEVNSYGPGHDNVCFLLISGYSSRLRLCGETA